MNYQSDWEVKKLGDIASYRKNNALVSKKKYISTENIKQNFEGIEQYKSKELVKGTSFEKNNILIANIRPYLRKIYLAEFCGSCSHDVLALESNEKVYATFLYYCLANDNFIGYVMSNVKGIKMPRGDKKHIMQYSIPLPPLSEQKAIADTLETFDAHIKNLSELIEKKKAIRDGALEDLMSGKIRLKSFSGDWEVKKLGELCKIFDGTHQTPKYTSRGIKFVSVENIYDLYQSEKYISHDAYISDFKVYPSKGDILMTRIGDIGTPCIVSKDEALAFYVSLALFKFIKINNEYLYHYIKSSAFQKELYDRTLHHATPKKINKGEIGKCLIKYPPLAEQQTIAETLTAFDDEIKALEAERDKITKIRDGAMNDLLTGKIRLKF